MTTSYYVVKHGRKPGIYNSWNECQQQVSGFSSPVFRKFNTLETAQQFLNSTGNDKSNKLITKTIKLHLESPPGLIHNKFNIESSYPVEKWKIGRAHV